MSLRIFLLCSGSFSEWSWRWLLCISLSSPQRALPFSSLLCSEWEVRHFCSTFPPILKKSLDLMCVSKEVQITEVFTKLGWLLFSTSVALVQCVTAAAAMRCSWGIVIAVFLVKGREWSCLEQHCEDCDWQSQIWVANYFCWPKHFDTRIWTDFGCERKKGMLLEMYGFRTVS